MYRTMMLNMSMFMTMPPADSDCKCLCSAQATEAMQANPEIRKLLDALEAEHEHLRGRAADMGKMLKSHSRRHSHADDSKNVVDAATGVNTPAGDTTGNAATAALPEGKHKHEGNSPSERSKKTSVSEKDEVAEGMQQGWKYAGPASGKPHSQPGLELKGHLR
jgi:hypothetical protein